MQVGGRPGGALASDEVLKIVGSAKFTRKAALSWWNTPERRTPSFYYPIIGKRNRGVGLSGR
jgi:hypothetical protein